jgi:hypothetical protein
LAEPDLIAEVFASWSRALTGARRDNKLKIFTEMARDAAGWAAAERQQAIDDMWAVAEEAGLVRLFGVSAVHAALVNAFTDGDLK